MDIDLSIESLQDYMTQLKTTIEDLQENRDKYSAKIIAMNQVWDAPSYTCFRDEALFIINGVFLQTIDNAITFRDILRRVSDKAFELRGTACAILDTLETGSDRGVGQDRSILFYDSAQASTIRSTAGTAECVLRVISRDYDTVSLELTKLKTINVLPSSEVIGDANVLISRLQNVESLMSDFERGLTELESEMSGIAENIDGARFISSGVYDSLLTDKDLLNRELALLLFKTPEHLLTAHEKELLQELKDAGYSLKRLVGSQGISVFAGLGMSNDIFSSLFSFGSAAYALLFEDESKLLRRLGRGIPGLGYTVGACDAFLTYDETYNANPQLAERRRVSDAQVETSVVIGETLALEGASFILERIGIAIGSAVAPGPGSIVGGAVGIVGAAAISIVYILNADQIQNETIRLRGSDGTSWLDDRKTDWYETWWSQN